MNKRIFISVLAILLAAVMFLSACGDKDKDTDTSKPSDSQNSIFDFNFGEEESVKKPTNNNKPSGNVVIDRRPLRTDTNYTSVSDSQVDIFAEDSENQYTYDIKVTTFDLNNIYYPTLGVKGIYFDNSQKNTANDIATQANNKIDTEKKLTGWITAMSMYDSDITAFQSLYPLMYHEAVGGVQITTESVFSKVFKDYAAFSSGNDPVTAASNLAILASKNSPYALTDLTTGYVGEKTNAKAFYVKGYMNIKGVKIAVYNLRLVKGDTTEIKDTWAELVTLMNKEDYCIVMGNMMSNDIAKYMQKNGFNAANRGDFGDFITYTWGSAQDGYYRDNIFTTANIDIKFVEIELDKKESSYYINPLTAYLKINTDMGSTKKTSPIETDVDGFINKWFKP